MEVKKKKKVLKCLENLKTATKKLAKTLLMAWVI